MRISDIMRLGKSAIIFATIVVAFLAIIWLLGYKMIYKKILHGKKQISIGRIGLVCVLAVYIVVVLYVTLQEEVLVLGDLSTGLTLNHFLRTKRPGTILVHRNGEI